MGDHQTFRNQDLVLEVNQNVDPGKFDVGRYEAFINALCSDREYQKEAIRTALLFMIGGRYADLRSLAEENYYRNPALRERFGSLENYVLHLQLPDRLAFTQDLATATGKSYVMYGIARVMLAEGTVDRILVLCPSLTIEKELTEKFRALSAEGILTEMLPANAVWKNPSIINGTETIVPGAVCIENFHAVLEHVGSSVRDSLRRQGHTTLVLNDEAHHIYNSPVGRDQASRQLKRWKEFLINTDFDFRYIGGFSGTCYIGNDYFTDVIYRYSLRQAMEDGFVKAVDYVAEDSSQTQDEKFQKIWANHRKNTLDYRQVKPLTILVTRDIGTCKDLAGELVSFLAEHEGISTEEANKKVLPVTSSSEHKANVRELQEVDRKENPVEWVVSVSMLTEGWDVKNVFQIVPHEERAFDSKLLIAQVLGRGLRLPGVYNKARVVVFNHDSWSSSIKGLVLEVIEQEKRLVCRVADKPMDYNFDLHQIDFHKVQKTEKIEDGAENEVEKGYVSLISQASKVESRTTYASSMRGGTYSRATTIRYRMHTVDDTIEKVHNKLKAIDLETGGGTTFSEAYDIDRLREIVTTSLGRIGVEENVVSEQNLQRILNAFGAINKTADSTVRYHAKAHSIQVVNTRTRPEDSIGFSSLRHDVRVFYDEHTSESSDTETKHYLVEIDADMHLEGALSQVQNSFNFKTPLNLVIANRNPEFRFIKQLTRKENAEMLVGWIKSTDKGFYAVEYAWQKGNTVKRGAFNPDFFIKLDDSILVIEIKDDGQIKDPSLENKAKYMFARWHFGEVNRRQKDVTYRFHFLTPLDFDLFFQQLREGKHAHFVSQLDAALAESS